MEDIVVSYERHGDYARNVLDYFLKRIYPGKNIKWVENNKSSKLIVYTKYGRNTTNKSKLYIGFSGESYAPPLLPKGYKGLYFLAHKKLCQNTLHFPYFLSSPYLYKEPIDNNIERPFLLAYCNSNPVQQRECFFSTMVQKTSPQQCHSLGKCNGSIIQTARRIEGDWTSNKLVEAYTQYKFVIAMENYQKPGYVTEKILNAFYSGAIPIYWGAPDIDEYFNPKAFINVSDFKNINECVDYVINMTTQQRNIMTSQPIYANTDIAFLMYDEDPVNELRDTYTKKISEFLNL